MWPVKSRPPYKTLVHHAPEQEYVRARVHIRVSLYPLRCHVGRRSQDEALSRDYDRIRLAGDPEVEHLDVIDVT